MKESNTMIDIMKVTDASFVADYVAYENYEADKRDNSTIYDAAYEEAFSSYVASFEAKEATSKAYKRAYYAFRFAKQRADLVVKEKVVS